uniref:Glycosyl transferase CAP10 domain-containing protein n=1 Tax=Panagrolaimus sp. PS1159 TaxID=55785 RepID=A0AC35F7H5_9BILA
MNQIVDEPDLLNPEECSCEKSIKPLPTVKEWIKDYCPLNSNHYKQLFEDLSNFKEINFEKSLQKVENNWGHPNQSRAAAVCRYKLSSNEIKKYCYGEYTGFSMFSDEILTSLARKMQLPEIEFIQNLGDWPLEFSNPNDSGVAIISWCGSNDTFDIIIPTYEIVEASLKALNTLARDMQNIKGEQFIPWTKKFNKAIFRGRDSNEFRLKVAKLALERPDLIDGGITRYFFFDEKENTKSVEHRPFNEFFKYRYILSIDGTVAAYRLPYLLGGNSVVLKQDSKFYEHFYTFLEPNIHFIPFNEENLIEKLEFIQTLQNSSFITSEARIIAREHLQPLNIYCYYAMFLQEYSKLYKSPTSESFLNVSMESVPLSPLKPSQTQKFCNCNELKEDSMSKIDEL